MLYKKFTIPDDKMIKTLIKDKNKFIKQTNSNMDKNTETGEMLDIENNTGNFKMNIERQFMEYTDSVAMDSKRESIAIRINEREMIAQRGCNPFLSQNNYINDLMNQEKYIRQNNNLNTHHE